MITIDLGRVEYFNSSTSSFEYEERGIVRFEYSLKTLYHWESKWKKPFLKGSITQEELVDFYKLMALDPIDDKYIDAELMQTLAEYIQDAHTATTFSSNGSSGGKLAKPKIYTSEELYALMISANVPLEFENRNLNRLLVILRIISAHNEPPKKMSKQDILRQNSELNRQRRDSMKTKG